MSDLKIRTDRKSRLGYKIGVAVGAILTIGFGAIVASGIIWGLVAIWQGILGG